MFDRSVFINCPFDAAYRPLLNAILFCVISCGLTPRLATERADGGENRLNKICGLMRGSRFSIHDLSRCQATQKGEISRLNMPFELGVDFGYRSCGITEFAAKKFLVLDEKPYRLKQALSDIDGWDTTAHDAKDDLAMKEVRTWLNQEAGANLPGASLLYDQFLVFDEWKYGQPDQARTDVEAYTVPELITAMTRWVELGRPDDPSKR